MNIFFVINNDSQLSGQPLKSTSFISAKRMDISHSSFLCHIKLELQISLPVYNWRRIGHSSIVQQQNVSVFSHRFPATSASRSRPITGCAVLSHQNG